MLNKDKIIIIIIIIIIIVIIIQSKDKTRSRLSPHNNFDTLTLPSKSHRDKWQENLSQARLFQILDPLLFSDIFFGISSQAFLWRETETGAYRGFFHQASHQAKIYRICADKFASLPCWVISQSEERRQPEDYINRDKQEGNRMIHFGLFIQIE